MGQPQYHKTKGAKQLQQHRPSKPLSSWATTLPQWPLHSPSEEIPFFSHFTKGIEKNLTVNSKAGFTINLKCSLTNTKKPNIYTQCSFPWQELTNHAITRKGLLHGLCTLVEWELLYLRRHILWFKAYLVLLHVEVNESCFRNSLLLKWNLPKNRFLSTDFYPRNHQEFLFPQPPITKTCLKQVLIQPASMNQKKLLI